MDYLQKKHNHVIIVTMREVTKCMVMSAGMGTRLEPLTLQVPKPLVPVCNKPVMDILFESLANIGIKDVICNTYYLSEQIIDRYTKNCPVNFNYIKEETLSGTAGGLKKCQFFFEEGETLVVLSADGLTNADIKHGIEVHQKSGAIATIGVKRIPKNEVSNFGVVVTDNDGFITEFQEKPHVQDAKSDCINTGIYIFNYKIFDYIPENTFYDFAKNVFPKLLAERQINTFVIEDYWSDIGTLGQYMTSTQDVFNGKCIFDHEKIVEVDGGAYLSASKIPDSTKFIGYSTIGKNCSIGKNVVIENSILWDNVTIRDNVLIKNSIIASGEVIDSDLSCKIAGCEKVVDL